MKDPDWMKWDFGDRFAFAFIYISLGTVMLILLSCGFGVVASMVWYIRWLFS